MAGNFIETAQESGPFKSIAVIGLGLMGASLAQAIRKAFPSQTILGWDADSQTMAYALTQGWLDATIDPMNRFMPVCELTFLAMPVSGTLRWIQQAVENQLFINKEHSVGSKQESQINRTETVSWDISAMPLIVDLGSVKRSVVEKMQWAAHQIHQWAWIGGHPLCGSERNGIDAAHPNLYQQATFFLTPVQSNMREGSEGIDQECEARLRMIERFEGFLEALAMKPVRIAADSHDVKMAMTSHMPHVLSAALVRTTQTIEPIFQGPGYRDMTRIAGGKSDLWQDILHHNRLEVIGAIERIELELQAVKALLNTEAVEETKTWLTCHTHSAVHHIIEGG